jgi:outer membrane lipoprotein-sorting protein
MQFFTRSIILASLFMSMLCVNASALTLVDLKGDDGLKEKITSDGKNLTEQVYKTIADLKDYKYESVLYMFNPDLRESGAGIYFFKRPNLIRLQIRSHGLKDGTVVVRQPDGRIRVAGGPKLRFLKMNVQEDSRVLQTPNGYNVIKSDLASLFATLTAALANGSKARATAAPISVNRFNQNVTVLQLVKPEGGAEQVTDRIFIDPQTDAPVEWDVFRNGDRYSITVFENFNANMGLEDDQFKL